MIGFPHWGCYFAKIFNEAPVSPVSLFSFERPKLYKRGESIRFPPLRNPYTTCIYFPLANLVRGSRGHVTSYVAQPSNFLLALYKGGREPQYSLFSDNTIIKLSYCFLSFTTVSHCQLAYIATPNRESKDILKILSLHIVTLSDSESPIMAPKDSTKDKARETPISK